MTRDGLDRNEQNAAVLQNLNFDSVTRLDARCWRQRDATAGIGLREHDSFLHELENKIKVEEGNSHFGKLRQGGGCVRWIQ